MPVLELERRLDYDLFAGEEFSFEVLSDFYQLAAELMTDHHRVHFDVVRDALVILSLYDRLVCGGAERVGDYLQKRLVVAGFGEREALLTATEAEGTKVLRIGLTGAYARSELDGRPYAASGAWRGADVFEIEARCVEFVSGSTLRLRFAPEGLLLSVTSALPNAGEARYALVPAR